MSLSVIIPTFNRVDELLYTLERVKSCSPPAREIIVHVDAGDHFSADAVRSAFSDVRVIQSADTLGPGGSRNRLMAIASSETIVSLDDDSFPLDPDFFDAVHVSMEDHPKAAVIAMNIIHDGEELTERRNEVREVAHFVGCGCAYRKSAFMDTLGYAPVQPAYGVEEADMALQLLDRGWSIVHDYNLRVRHATSRAHHASASITSAHISNIALLAFLRYPARYWPLGLAQVLNRVIWSIRNKRYSGIINGILTIPSKLWRFRRLRRAVRPSTMRKVKALACTNIGSKMPSSTYG